MYANNAQGDGRVCAEIFIEEPNAKFLTEDKLARIENKKQSELIVTQIAGFCLVLSVLFNFWHCAKNSFRVILWKKCQTQLIILNKRF